MSKKTACTALSCLLLCCCRGGYHTLSHLHEQEDNADGTARLLEAAQLTHPGPQPAQVRVTLEGDWSWVARTTQPDLTDPDFRVRSMETYHLPSGDSHQLFDGYAGLKEVSWNRRDRHIQVWRNYVADQNNVTLTAAALVADAYPMFHLGAIWLLTHGDHPVLCGEEVHTYFDSQGEPCREICDLIAITLSPGFGLAEEDRVVAWIGRDTGRTHVLQMSLTAFAPTRNAEAVIKARRWQVDDAGHHWPVELREEVYVPFFFRVHDWNVHSLSWQSADGTRCDLDMSPQSSPHNAR